MSFPVVVPVLKTIVPATVSRIEVEEPRIVHLVTVLLDASAINRIVLVPVNAAPEVLESVREDPATNWPSIVTLSAPLKSINGLPTISPETVRAPTALIVSEVHELTEGCLKTAGIVSKVSQVMETVMLLVACVPLALSAANASRSVT